MTELKDPVGIAALAAGAVALVALLLGIFLAVRLRGLRAAQRAVLGSSGREDLVAHAAGLQEAFAALHDRVEEMASHLDARVAAIEERVDATIAYRALVRYDAYGELSGHQSTSIALLDAHRNGVVLSCIAHRDTARLYCKQVLGGQGETLLSPEEAEAVKLAVTGGETSRILT